MNSDKYIRAVEGMNDRQRDIMWGLWLKVKYFDKKPYHDDRPYVRWDDVELVVADLLEEEKKKVKNSKNKGVIVNGCAGSIEDRILGTGGTGTVPVDPPRGRLKE